MALSIKTDKADRLARELAQLTGDSITDAVTKALEGQLEREREKRAADKDFAARIKAHAARLRTEHDIRNLRKREWDDAWGDNS